MEFSKPLFGHFLGILLIAGLFVGYHFYTKNSLLRQFDVTTDKITKDMEGRQVQISHGQIWPFDNGQGMTISVVHKKQVENFVVLVVDVKATASVDQPKEQPKDQKNKDKEKLPTRVNVGGHLKLTYELFGNDWYLVAVDALTAKASAQFD